MGIAVGIQNSFSFTELAASALTAGITAGVPQLPGVSALDGALETVPDIGQALAKGVNDIIGSALAQGVEVATGLQSKFSWVGVAVAGVDGFVATALAPTIDSAFDVSPGANGRLPFTPAGAAAGALTGAAGAVAAAATNSVITGQDFGHSLDQVLPGVIGQTIGNAIAGHIEQQQSTNGQSENPLQALWGGIKQIGGEIVGGVETIGSDVVNGVESLFGGGDSAVATVAADGPPPGGPSGPTPSHAPFAIAPPPIDSSLVGSPEYAALPPNVAVGPVTVLSMGGDPELVAAELQKLPTSVLNTLAANGTVVAAVPNSVADYDPSLSGVSARGRSGTWDTIPGAYLPDQNVVVIATSGLYNDNQGAYDLVLHETGHAYDAALGAAQHSPGGLASNSAAFQQAYKGTVGTYDLSDRWQAYFTPQANPTGYLSESFAESFADTFGGAQSTIADVFTHPGTPVLASPARQSLTNYWKPAQ